MKEGPISQWDSTTTNPPHWSGDMYQNNLTGPPHTGASPRPSPPPPLFSLPVLYCKLRQQTRGQWGQELHVPLPLTAITHYVPLEPTNNQSMGQWGQELPLRITAITHYLWNQPLTPILQVNSILQNLTPTLPAREHQLPHNQRINVAPT